MTVKDQVLLLLENQREVFFSGQDIAQQLSVTRASVWKAVKALQKEGYAIEAVNNKGYILKMAPDVLSGAYIEERLKKAGHGSAGGKAECRQGPQRAFLLFTRRHGPVYESFTAS